MGFWKSQDASEKEIENSIFEWLERQEGVLAFKVNTQGVYDVNRKTFRKTGKNVIKGTSDIVLSINVMGIPVYASLEVKSRTGRQSDDQKLFEQRLKAVGSFYFVVRSIEDAQKALIEVKYQVIKKLQGG